MADKATIFLSYYLTSLDDSGQFWVSFDKFRRVCTFLDKFALVWTRSDTFGQFWANPDNFVQVCTSFNKFENILDKSRQVRTSFDTFEPVYASSDNSWQF